MIRQIINVDNYWKVIVYYNIDYDFWHIIDRDLRTISSPVKENDAIYRNMCSTAKAFTVSNTTAHISITGFNYHTDDLDYINSIAHEAEHIKQAMLYAYNINDIGEPPAYTIGYLVMQMLKIHII